MSCPNCPGKVLLSSDPLASQAKVFDKACCFKTGDIGLNLFSALLRIEQAISEAATPQGAQYHQGILHFKIDSQDLSLDETVDVPFSVAPFTYEVLAIGVSQIPVFTPGDLELKLLDYNTVTQIGNTLHLTSNTRHDKHDAAANSQLGIIVGERTYGVRMTQRIIGNVTPEIDFYIHVRYQLPQ